MMDFIVGLLFVIDIICAFLLIGIILIQQSKSGGGLGAIAGGMGESVFGAAAGNVITKATVILATVFMTVTLLLAVISGRRDAGTSLRDRLLQDAPVGETSPGVDSETMPAEIPALGVDVPAGEETDN